jgi:hypothetical protein
VLSFAQDPTAPSKLYAATLAGLYRSSDGGNSWTASNTGLPSIPEIRAIAVDPELPTTLYAGGIDSAKLYKSINGGASWTESDTGLTVSGNSQLDAITVDPHHSKAVYAAPYNNGLFKSMDGGATWQESDTGMGATKNIYAVAVDPTDSTKVYAASQSKPSIYKSTDGGATWVEADTGVPPYQIFDALLIDPVDPSILYLSSSYYSAGESYVSKDGAATWQPLNSGTLAAASISLGATLIDPLSHSHVYSAGSDGKLYVLAIPVANDGMVNTTAGKSASGTLSATLAYPAQTLTFALVSVPLHGSVILTDAATGAFQYVPSDGYAGPDSFTFHVTGIFGNVSNVATEQVTVADIAATANDGSFTIVPNVTLSAALTATPAYIGQTLTYSIVSNPSHGSVSADATGRFYYKPAQNYLGTDSFTFHATDQYGTASNVTTEQVSITGPAPTANGASLSTKPNIAISGTLSATRGYANQVLTFSVVAQPVHGSVSLNAGTGKFTYTPATGFAGTDSFTFQATDTVGTSSNVAAVTVAVSDVAPKANGGILKLQPHTSSYSGVLKAVAAYGGQTLTYRSVGTPSHGTLTITNPSTGAYTLTATPALNNASSFKFQVVDQWGMVSNTATVTVLVL